MSVAVPVWKTLFVAYQAEFCRTYSLRDNTLTAPDDAPPVPMLAVTGDTHAGVTTMAQAIANYFANQAVLVPCARWLAQQYPAGQALCQACQTAPDDQQLQQHWRLTLFQLQIALEELFRVTARRWGRTRLICDHAALDYLQGPDRKHCRISWNNQGRRYCGSLWVEAARPGRIQSDPDHKNRWLTLARPSVVTLPFVRPSEATTGVGQRAVRAIAEASRLLGFGSAF